MIAIVHGCTWRSFISLGKPLDGDGNKITPESGFSESIFSMEEEEL
jgi:hypothetical protein